MQGVLGTVAKLGVLGALGALGVLGLTRNLEYSDARNTRDPLSTRKLTKMGVLGPAAVIGKRRTTRK